MPILCPSSSDHYLSLFKASSYNPLKSTPSNTSDGMRHEEDIRGSLPTADKEAPKRNHITRDIHFADGLGQFAIFNQEALYTIREVSGATVALPPLNP